MRILSGGVVLTHLQECDGADDRGFRSAPVGEGDDFGNVYGDGITSTRIATVGVVNFFTIKNQHQ